MEENVNCEIISRVYLIRVSAISQTTLDTTDLASNKLEQEVKVLKDFWIPGDARTDLEMRTYIRSNLLAVNAVPGLKIDDFDNYFVVTEACERIQVPSTRNSVNSVNDSSTNFLRGHTLPPNFKRFHLSHPSKSQTYERRPCSSIPQSQLVESVTERDQRRATTNEITKLTARSHYKNKVHCRTLSEYAGETLEETQKWSSILTALSKSATGEAFVVSRFPYAEIMSSIVIYAFGRCCSQGCQYREHLGSW